MKYCIANWKMNMNQHETSEYLRVLTDIRHENKEKYLENIEGVYSEEIIDHDVLMIICPPYTLIEFIWDDENFRLMNSKYDYNPMLGIQNFHPETKGAYTGEVSLDMFASTAGYPISFPIVGHSERRRLFNESNEFINLKIKTALDWNLKPILCIGETLEARERGETENVLYDQLKNCLKDIDVNPSSKSWPASYADDFLIAYEPVWAIGTGKTADNDTIESANNTILDIIKDLKYEIKNPKILYGGSVNNNNAKNLSKICNLDGFLIGGASLDAKQFYSIYNALKGE